MPEPLKVPTIEELKRAYDEGSPVGLISGIEVQMRSVRPEVLLRSGTLPDTLSQLVHKSLFEDVSQEFTDWVTTERADTQETLEMIAGVDAVCEAALIDPSIVPYLSLSDRMWIYKLAFLPAAVLSRFRDKPSGDVEGEADGEGNVQPTERATVRD